MSQTEPLAPRPAVLPCSTTEDAARAFSTSVLVSATRCLLTYVVFPWVLPLLGLASGVGPAVGLVVGVVAIAANVASIRRFWVTGHRWRVPIALLNSTIIVMLVVLIGIDVADLAG